MFHFFEVSLYWKSVFSPLFYLIVSQLYDWGVSAGGCFPVFTRSFRPQVVFALFYTFPMTLCNLGFHLMHRSCLETARLCISGKVTSSVVYWRVFCQLFGQPLGWECLWSDPMHYHPPRNRLPTTKAFRLLPGNRILVKRWSIPWFSKFNSFHSIGHLCKSVCDAVIEEITFTYVSKLAYFQ